MTLLDMPIGRVKRFQQLGAAWKWRLEDSAGEDQRRTVPKGITSSNFLFSVVRLYTGDINRFGSFDDPPT